MKIIFSVLLVIFLPVLSLSQTWPIFDDDDETTSKPSPRPTYSRTFTQRTTTRNIATTTSRSKSKLLEERISVKKCSEYKDLVLDKESSIIISAWPASDDGALRYSLKEYNCSSFTGLIVGGTKADPGEFPHMAAVGWRLPSGSVSFKCGGSLISEKFVLTVAHCSYDDGLAPNLVRLGDLNLARSDDKAEPVDYDIKRIIIHDQYSFTRENDIALLELKNQVKFTKFIRPACLSHEENYKKQVVATGWGQNTTYGDTLDDLMKVRLQAVNAETCRTAGLPISYPGQMCVKGQLNMDTCKGDSGGPIQISHKDVICVYDIIGLTSYGNKRCGGSSTAIYTRVQAYIDWIEEKVWG